MAVSDHWIHGEWFSHAPHPDLRYGLSFWMCAGPCLAALRDPGGLLHCLCYWCSSCCRLATKWKEAFQLREDLWGTKGRTGIWSRENPFPLLLFYFPLVSDPEEQLWMETSRASIGCWAVTSRYYWPQSLTGSESPGNTSWSRICFNTGKDVVKLGVAEYWWKQTTWFKEITYKVVFNSCLCLE